MNQSEPVSGSAPFGATSDAERNLKNPLPHGRGSENLSRGADDQGQVRTAAALTAVCLAASVVCGLRSDGVHHFDDLTHLLFAKWAADYPAYLVHDWGRPGFTVLYFLPAQLGWPAARVFSALLSAAAAWMAFRIAQRLGSGLAWIVPAVTFLQPLFFVLSLTTLTETALAFYLTAAVYLAARGRWTASSAVLSVGFVTRHEALVFLPLWLIAARRKRVALARLWPLVWAPLVVNVLARLAGLNAPIDLLFNVFPSGDYGRGGWLTFFSRSMEAWGPALSALGFAGLSFVWTRPGGLLVAGSAAIYFAAQTVIRVLGAFDAGGYPRFLVPVSPLTAVAAAVALESLAARPIKARLRAARRTGAMFLVLWIAMEVQLRRPETPAFLPEIHAAKIAVRVATGIVAVLVAAAWWFGRHGPRGVAVARRVGTALTASLAILAGLAFHELAGVLRIGPGEQVAIEAVSWLRGHGYGDRPVLSAHVYVDYLLGYVPPPHTPGLRERVAAAPVGSIVLWDRQFAPASAVGFHHEDVENPRAFRPLHAGRPLPHQTEPQIRLYEKIGPWP